ncbi:MAG: type II and III secretion system protein family protein [Alphaproteobacteria bacterium]
MVHRFSGDDEGRKDDVRRADNVGDEDHGKRGDNKNNGNARKGSILLRRIFSIALAFAMAAPSSAISETYLPPDNMVQPETAPLKSSSRVVNVGLNKSVLINLPADVSEVIVSNTAVVEAVVRTNRHVHLLGQKIGQASATFVSREGETILTLDVVVERDLTQVARLIRRLIPKARVQLEMVNDNIVLSGAVTSPEESTRVADIAARFVGKSEQVLNLLTVDAKEQVLLRVTVAEMNRSALRRLGVDLSETFSAGTLSAVKVAETAFPVTGSIVAGAVLDRTAKVLEYSASGSALAAGFSRGKSSVDALVQALEREGLAHTLAKPNLTSVSGETADFLAGGEYPVPVGSDNNGMTITFKSFGVGLKFTPVVLSGGRINLKIATQMSELTTEGAVTVNSISIPALKVRRASSTLELPSGGSVVMAGLISQQTRRSAEGIPGLKQLPVLGHLFRSDDFIRSETELVVLVTPYLVRSTPRDALETPAEHLPPPPNAHVTAKLTAGDDFGFIIE